MLRTISSNFRLLILLGGMVAAGVAGAWLYNSLRSQSETTFSDIDSKPFYEYESNDGESIYRSDDGINFVNEEGDTQTRDEFEEDSGLFSYHTVTGEVFQSLDGELYVNEDESAGYIVDANGEWSFVDIDEFIQEDRGGAPTLDQIIDIRNVDIQGVPEGYGITPTFGLLTDPQTFLRVSNLEDFDFGDIDGDGDLDVAIGRASENNRVYLNEAGGYVLIWEEASPRSGRAFNTSTVEWGDADGDGDLDLAIATRNNRNAVYLNENGRIANSPVWTDKRVDITYDLKWADMNGDGYLDLVFANGSNFESHIFFNQFKNENGTFSEEPDWSGLQAEKSVAVDIGHFNADSALDIAFAIDAESRNEGVIILQNDLASSNEMVLIPFETPVMGTVSNVAWGPMNESGSQMLAVADGARQGDPVLQNRDDQMAQLWKPDRDLTALDAEWGDVNGDGFLDLAIATSANGRERVYLYDERTGGLEETPSWRADGFSQARQLEWADLDNDRDLDLVVHYGDDLVVYVNQLPPILQNANDNDGVAEGVNSYAIDMADFNQDGLIDIAIGYNHINSTGVPNVIYLNDGGDLFLKSQTVLVGNEANQTYGIAWADVDNDGVLDLGVANGDGNVKNLIYYGQSDGTNYAFDAPPLELPVADNSRDLAWGDVDNDGDLDLVIANYLQPNLLYINNGQETFSEEGIVFGFDENGNGFRSIRLDFGDVDADGDLDLAVVNDGEQNRVYINNNGRYSDESVQIFGSNERSFGADWGDYNGDGQLDLAVANRNGANQLFWNAGGYLWPQPIWESADIDDSHSLAWGDVDGDGDLDLAVANRGGENLSAPIPNKLYLNINGTLQTAREDSLWNSNDRFPSTESRAIREHLPSFDVAWADINNDGDLDLVFANGARLIEGATTLPIVNQVYENELVPTISTQLNVAPATIAINDISADGESLALLNTQSVVVGNGRLDIEYTLTHPEDKPFATVQGFYSLDGGHTFSPAEPVTGTVLSNLPTTFGQNRHTYSWDVFESGFFGLSSQVVFRLEAYEVASPNTVQDPGTYMYDNQPGQEAKRGQVAVNSFPLRIRGNQLQVMFECDATVEQIRPCPENMDSEGQIPLENAAVYGLPASEVVGAQLLKSLSGQVFGTDGQGYLQGRTILSEGDQLISLWPVPTETLDIPFTNRARIFYMSGQPNELSLENTKVEELSGVQKITVSNKNPLVLYDLIVSIEWDASQDSVFMTELDNAFKRASDILFDVTNGQVAIGNVFVFHSKMYWNIADIVIVANNDLRPSAAIGGVVTSPVDEVVLDQRTADPTDTKLIVDAYLPGQIRMGPNWDPFGESRAELTEDWYRALAHELAHYFFFLPDDYLGIQNGILRRIDCQGSFMTTTRDPSYSEFLNEALWLGDCQDTVAEQTTTRNNWETIEQFYPFFNIPAPEEALLEGPNLLPLDVTNLISFGLDYGGVRQRLPNRIFEIKDETGDRIRVPNAMVYMIQTQGTMTETDDVYINMGTTGPGGDRVQVRGAFDGDLLCISDPNQEPPRHGCEELDNSDVSISLEEQTAWSPIIEVKETAVISKTQMVTFTLKNIPANEQINVQVFSSHYNSFSGNWGASPIEVISSAESNADSVVEALEVGVGLPRFEFDITVRVWIDDGSNRETVTQFILKPVWEAGEFEIPNTITLPITQNFSYVLIGSPNNVPLGGPNNVPLGGPNNVPLGGPNNVPLGGPNNVPLGGPNNVPLGGPNNVPLGGPNNVPLGGPNNVPLGGPNNVPLGGPNNVPLGGPNNVPLGGPNNVPLGGPNNVPLGGPNNVPLGGPNNVPLGGPNNVPLGGPNNVPLGGPNNVPLGGSDGRTFGAPILSADAQVIIHNNFGFFEENGVETLQLLANAPDLAPWYVQVGQAYRVEFEPDFTDERSIAFSYLQRDVPAGFEDTLQIAFLEDGSNHWTLLDTEQFVENLVVTKVVTDTTSGTGVNGVYSVVSTIEGQPMSNGWNLLAYPVPISRPVNIALGSIISYTTTVVDSIDAGTMPPVDQYALEAELTAKTDINIRSGPSIDNEMISYLLQDEMATVRPYALDANWQIIECPERANQSDVCWITGRSQFVQIESVQLNDSGEYVLEFGHVYWVLIEGLEDGQTIIPYLAPPTLSLDGQLE